MGDFVFFSLNTSWLCFNGRVLCEAKKDGVPLVKRLTFLSICSFNPDKWRRVRMPVMLAKEDTKIKKATDEEPSLPDDSPNSPKDDTV